MSFFSNKWKITVLIILLISGGSFVLNHFVGFNPVGTVVNTVLVPVRDGFSYVSDSLRSARNFIYEMRAYKADNEKLEREIIELKREKKDVGEYKEENERLKRLLDIEESMEDYETVAARVISHSQNRWYEEIEINKGTLNGIKDGSAVITPDGVVGKVTEAGPNYSIVTTILDRSSVMGARVVRTGGTGLVEGDYELLDDMQCKLSFVDRNTPVTQGDVLETSGSGGIYPPGLVIGTVVSVSADSTGTLNFATIEPGTDMDKLREVLVIMGE